MYKITAEDKQFKATIKLPFSKSESNRALMMQRLSVTQINLDNVSNADDTRTLQKLLWRNDDVMNTGEGGTTFRFMLAFCALAGINCELQAGPRMSQRPISNLVDALNFLGANITYVKKKGFAPVRINAGLLTGSKVIIDASISSQFISALMLIAPYMPYGLTIHLKGKIVSPGYINLTAKMMKQAGAEVTMHKSKIEIANKPYMRTHFTITPDWSAASYFVQAVFLNPKLQIYLPGLQLNSFQPDSKIVQVFEPLGLTFNHRQTGLVINNIGTKVNTKKVLNINCIDFPDVAPTIAIALAAAGYSGNLTGLQTLVDKETNRIVAIEKALTNIGAECKSNHNSIRWKAQELKNNFKPFNTYKDHRFVMALTMLAFTFKSIKLYEIESVAKSFPHFFEEMRKLGINVKNKFEVEQFYTFFF